MAMVIDPNLNYDYEIMCTHTQHVLMPKIWPENMMETIEAIVKLLSRCPKSPLFKFEMNGEAAESNFHVLRKFNFDLEKALVAQVGSPVVYRSEFSKGELLLPLLKNHLLWNRMKEMLAHGSQWPTEPITKEDRVADLIEALKFGIHKGATTQPELLLKLVTGDVKYRCFNPRMHTTSLCVMGLPICEFFCHTPRTQKNILASVRIFPDKFLMYGVKIESLIESPMISSTILNSSGT